MKSKQYSIEYMKRTYRGKYQTTILKDDIKTLIVEPELEEPKSEVKVNYIDDINVDYGVKKREYYIKKFLSELLYKINIQKTRIDEKNKKIIKYWLQYIEDFKVDEMYEMEIAEDPFYRKLQCKQNLFIDIIGNNNKKELLLLDKEISPERLGFRSEFTKILLAKLVENINNDNDGITIAIVNDAQGFIKDNLVSKIRDVDNIILIDDYYDKKFLKESFLGRFDHVISVNSLHRIEDVETFLKFSKLMLNENGRLHVIDFGKMDPVSILVAAFFQDKYLDIETEKRRQFFYRIDYIKKITENYFIKNTLSSVKDDIAYYFESESCTNYLELIKELKGDIGSGCDEGMVWFSSEDLDLDYCRNEVIKYFIDNCNQKNEDIEDVLKAIWRQNLEVDNIDINSNYFKLGGNSLSATKLLVEIEKRLKCKLMLNEIFVNPEFESLLKLIYLKQSDTEIIEGEI
ncbi:MAG: acyl carrier protein [Filifactoraceae bacterium]